MSGAVATLNELHGASQDFDGSNLQPNSARKACLERIREARRAPGRRRREGMDRGPYAADTPGGAPLENLIKNEKVRRRG